MEPEDAEMKTEKIKKILAWAVILAAAGALLILIVYALLTRTGRTVLAAIGGAVLVIELLTWAISEVTGW